MNDFNSIKVGDKVFYTPAYSSDRQVKTISRVTENFLFIENKNAAGESFEVKFRRKDGYAIEGGSSYVRSCLTIPKPGEIEQNEIDKQNKVKINEIIEFLHSKGFKYTGDPQWYSIEQWEAMEKVFKTNE